MMISLIVHAGAVPFGYTREMDDCEVQCFSYDDHIIACDTMSWMNSRASTTGHPPLPDLVTSNTPPSSPLRRAHSYHFLFPEKPSIASRARMPPTPSAHARNTPPPPSQSTPSLPSSRAGGVASSGDRLTTGLKHIQEVRQRVRKDPSFLDRRQNGLPQLTWEVPRYRNVSTADEGKKIDQRGCWVDEDDGSGEERKEEEEGEPREGEETAQQRTWRLIGRDLRKLGDQFAVKHSQSVGAKPNNNGYLNLVVPLTLTRCLSASVLCLVWWRLLNKLR
ncbi:uncharacterized protein LOC122258564 [Penaeus japonicus]|uniref:uncharacterized protein LOC122258564 n=1 Tax=Penaeus japonicus TaxID=27405 RepID=UPI001C70E5EB|nr:uncharacterized protein LOC122258564 [Penaeus japonicus]